jgi:hypothetical protein
MSPHFLTSDLGVLVLAAIAVTFSICPFSLTLLSCSIIKDNQPITMLATSHKPFAFKILPLTPYSPKILAAFTTQIFDSTRPGGQ